MKKRISHSLERMSKSISSPDDYYAGRRRPVEELPDNVLLFTRQEGRKLRSASITSSLHQRWVLILALQGSGTVEMDRVPMRLTSGRAILVPPLHLHSYSKMDTQLLWLFVTFEWPGHTALKEAWQKTRYLDTKAMIRLDTLVKVWQTSPDEGLLIASHLFLLLRYLFPKDASTSKSPPSPSGLVANVRDVALEKTDARLEAVAHRVGLSESHLRTKFRQETGISLGRYLREARLRQSAVWLHEENLSVKSAAERAGYPNIYSFSRAFKKALGIPPSRIRNFKQPASP